jgi:phosphopantothenoylcysteine decarboxylase/phosphopantothenate--cysteine ligase
MSLLAGKKILLGISGGIAAYKTPLLVRLLIKQGATVRVVMTPAATDFVTPLTLSVVSQNEVLSTFTSPATDHEVWNDHVELGSWGDVFLIAPATANTLSAMAHAKCNNLLIATYLSARCPVLIAPAMDLDMYAHPANQKNMASLQEQGVEVLPVASGPLASGFSGAGRMLEPEEIVDRLQKFLRQSAPLHGQKVLITAGPTYEAIDPVRFIGNHSSGRMGVALAQHAQRLGAQVSLVIGPNQLDLSDLAVDVIPVVSAQDMHQAVMKHFDAAQIVIAAAAVADYTPKHTFDQKIKKSVQAMTNVELVPTVDILAEMGAQKKNQFLVGFALETTDELAHAQQKRKAKNLDAIVLNSLQDAEAGFGLKTNKITYIDKKGNSTAFPVKTKEEVAEDIFAQILKYHA